jgi:hypothetical protein
VRKRRKKKVERVTRKVVPEDHPERWYWDTRCLCEPPCAAYRCLRCDSTWRCRPEDQPCPYCGHDYVKWENYEAWRKTHR